MENFTPISAVIGGAVIGLSATLMLVLHGRIAGVTGIVGGAIDPDTAPQERLWRLVFILGLLFGATVAATLFPGRFELGIDRNAGVVALAGVLVGLGTRLGSGCTSGHGVCGISRGSRRSLTATAVFVATGILTVLAYRSIAGGV